MNISIYNSNDFIALADAIREANATSDALQFPKEFDVKIRSINNNLERKFELETYTNETAAKIARCAFYGCESLKTVNLPNVTEIGPAAFISCPNLLSVNTPNVTQIRESAFERCLSLSSVDLSNVTEIEAGAFYQCESLQSVDCPLLTKLEDGAFGYCSGLTSINFPNVTEVGNEALAGLDSMEYISLPSAITIGARAISKHSGSGLVVDLPNATTLDNTFDQCKLLLALNAPKVERIIDEGYGYSCFYRCYGLTELEFPELLEICTSDCFKQCTGLMHFSAPKLKSIGATSVEGMEMYQYAFDGCTELVSAYMPSLETTSPYLFNGCSKLESADFPLLRGAPGSRMFNGCRSLSYINLPNVELISWWWIKDNNLLTELDMPKLTSVTQESIRNCTALKKVSLGAVIEIANNAFLGCSSLDTLIITQANSVCTLSHTNGFSGTKIASGTGLIYVPDALVANYQAATNWSTFADQIKPLSEYVLCTGVSVSAATLEISDGTSQTLTTTLTPENTVEDVSWSSSDMSVAYVLADGTVVPKKNGTAVITAKCGDQSATCSVTVSGMTQVSFEDALYQLSEGTAFTGENYIDTGLKLGEEDIDFTIFADITTDRGNGEYKTIFHCVDEGSDSSDGYSMDINGADNVRFSSWGTAKTMNIPNKTKVSNFKVAITHAAGSGSVTIKHLYNGSTTSQTTSSYTWTSVPKNLYLGCFQNKNDVRGRYWKGAIHDFAILNRVAADDEITAYLV